MDWPLPPTLDFWKFTCNPPSKNKKYIIANLRKKSQPEGALKCLVSLV